jgi:hypothetical protein
VRAEIGELVIVGRDLQDEARAEEEAAHRLTEQAIEEL